MTTPDLAALRALMDLLRRELRRGLNPLQDLLLADERSLAVRIVAILPAAQEALERVEGSITLMDTNNYSGVLKSSSVALAEQAARLARLEEALLLARNVVRHAQMADPTHVEEYQEIEARCDAALEGRDE